MEYINKENLFVLRVNVQKSNESWVGLQRPD
jgi:hypothetical protein